MISFSQASEPPARTLNEFLILKIVPQLGRRSMSETSAIVVTL